MHATFVRDPEASFTLTVNDMKLYNGALKRAPASSLYTQQFILSPECIDTFYIRERRYLWDIGTLGTNWFKNIKSSINFLFVVKYIYFD